MMDEVEQGDANIIHSSAIISSSAKIGKRNFFGPGVWVRGPVTIGDDNYFSGFSCIGTEAEFKGDHGNGSVVIGNKNRINEYVTIHASAFDGEATVIGNNTYIMTKAHVGHDAVINDEATLSSLAIVGGHSIIQSYANIGLGAVVHQKRVVGKYSMVGMNSTVTKSIPPYVIGWGSPCKPYRINMVGLQRRGLDPKMIEAIGYWLSKEQTGVEIKHELSYLVEEQVEVWSKLVENLGGK